MSSETTNIGLVLPELSEAFDLERHWNHNSTIIDAEIGALKQTTAEHTQDIEGLKQTTTAQGQLIAGKQDALTFDSTPTSGSDNPMTSGGIYTDQQRQETEIGAVAALGAKNLLQITAESQTKNGVEMAVNADGTLTFTRTATASSDSYFTIATFTGDAERFYTLTGCPQGGTDSTFYQYIGGTFRDYGSGVTRDGGALRNVVVFISKNYSPDNLVFKPMLRPAEITDSTYVPYAPTNRELYETSQPSYDFIFGLGTVLQPNDDLNNYNAPGKIYAATGAVAATISNSPWTASGFMAITIPFISATSFMQFVLPNSVGGKWYRRRYTQGAWSAWIEYDGTQVAASQSASPASLMQAGRLDAEMTDAQEVTDDA